jgi:hypothetical protein
MIVVFVHNACRLQANPINFKANYIFLAVASSDAILYNSRHKHDIGTRQERV